MSTNRKRPIALAACATVFFGGVFPAVAMIRHVALLEPPVPLDQFDAWYTTVHSVECMKLYGPWLRRYESYKARTPAAGDVQTVYYQGRYTELWYDSVESFREAAPMSRTYSATPWPGGQSRADRPTARLLVPAMPTEDFLATPAPTASSKPFRWIMLLGYPEGVNVEEADKWYVSVHAQEAKNMPGLVRYISYKAVKDSPLASRYIRVTEMWFQNYAAYSQAVNGPKTRYTKAPWAKGNEPEFLSASILVDYEPDLIFKK
jgi:uncharacterized protein (TIGR02118 family)